MARGGIDIAVAEINPAGGVNGRKIEVKYEDNQQQPVSAAIEAQKLVGDGIKVIFTHGSSMTAAVTKVTESKDVLLANIASQSDVVVAHPQVYNFIPTNNMEPRGRPNAALLGGHMCRCHPLAASTATEREQPRGSGATNAPQRLPNKAVRHDTLLRR